MEVEKDTIHKGDERDLKSNTDKGMSYKPIWERTDMCTEFEGSNDKIRRTQSQEFPKAVGYKTNKLTFKTKKENRLIFQHSTAKWYTHNELKCLESAGK